MVKSAMRLKPLLIQLFGNEKLKNPTFKPKCTGQQISRFSFPTSSNADSTFVTNRSKYVSVLFINFKLINNIDIKNSCANYFFFEVEIPHVGFC